ncbi:MAG: hypothetical protein RL266_2431 [Bacteroidota bacterium]
MVFGAEAQERLFDLHGNNRLSNYEEYLRSGLAASRAAGDTVDLPFFDDFSEPFSRLRNLGDDYPNPALWQGNTVYVNNHMAINPISQGVATFDGLNERGRAYAFGLSIPTLSDSLTSNCIRLANAPDTVYLSFFYQAQGMGNAPEFEDLLVLEFKDTANTWDQVWDANGYILEDFNFNRVMLPIVDEKYLFDGFQFRFTNYASLSGNVDHWHIDYVELDGGRSGADTLIDDVAFMSQTSVDYNGFRLNATSSVLKEYNSMPWNHFKENPSEFLGDSTYFCLRNNKYESSPEGYYSLRIYNAFDSLLHVGLVASPNVFPNVVCGNEPNTCAPIVQGEEDLLYDFLNYELPTNKEISEDSMFFNIVHDVDSLFDDVSTNDRTAQIQEFYNYYAYDDGTAEAAYGLGELENVGRVAVKYNIKKLDTLRAIQLYLNPVEFDLSQEPVQLVVWGGNEEPDDVKWVSDPLFLNYTDHINYFYHYFLEDTVLRVVDNIWVGWIQQPATNQKFSIGFDQRTDNSDKVFYNLGTTWSQSSIPGSIMIRPVFGSPYSWVGVNEEPVINEVLVYPNPSTGTVHLQENYAGQLTNASVQVFDLSGRMVFTQSGNVNTLKLDQLIAGTYILRVESEKGVFTQRLILQ